DSKQQVMARFEAEKQAILPEFKSLEPALSIELQTAEQPENTLDEKSQKELINAMYAAHQGDYRMSPAIADLVETSNNIARVLVAEGSIHIGCLTRSSVESSKADLSNALRATFENAGLEVGLSGDYPGWAPNMDSPILKVMEGLYNELFNEQPHVAACHAGLECGILGQNYPGMDMISFGPTIKGAHSPDERASISSVQKYWNYVIETLKRIPENA
ncbi:M20/M25/M40 family metallo-hydrolase, partial [Gilvibacter sp.]|uniref:M20/M25/M40 family metallo-hydrolase n=1 Tax=Gilvibacter sp. TaxID=2729997 RepID=UPI0025BE9D67